MANFRVISQSGAAASHTAAILKFINDRTLARIQMRKIENDKKYKESLLRSEGLLNAAKIRESSARTEAAKEAAQIARKSAEVDIATKLMGSFTDTFQNGLKRGDISEAEFNQIQLNASQTIPNMRKAMKASGVSDELADAMTQQSFQSVVIVGAKRDVANELMAREPFKHDAILRHLKFQGIEGEKARQMIKSMTPQEIDGVYKSATRMIETEKTIASDNFSMAEANLQAARASKDPTAIMAATKVASEAKAMATRSRMAFEDATGQTAKNEMLADRTKDINPLLQAEREKNDYAGELSGQRAKSDKKSSPIDKAKKAGAAKEDADAKFGIPDSQPDVSEEFMRARSAVARERGWDPNDPEKASDLDQYTKDTIQFRKDIAERDKRSADYRARTPELDEILSTGR